MQHEEYTSNIVSHSKMIGFGRRCNWRVIRIRLKNYAKTLLGKYRVHRKLNLYDYIERFEISQAFSVLKIVEKELEVI